MPQIYEKIRIYIYILLFPSHSILLSYRLQSTLPTVYRLVLQPWVTNILKVHSTNETEQVVTQEKRQSVLPHLYT